jgi:hypothetical protein
LPARQSCERRHASARSNGGLWPPNPQRVRPLSIRVEEQTRDALRRTTDYTTKLRQKDRTVVPITDRKVG